MLGFMRERAPSETRASVGCHVRRRYTHLRQPAHYTTYGPRGLANGMHRLAARGEAFGRDPRGRRDRQLSLSDNLLCAACSPCCWVRTDCFGKQGCGSHAFVLQSGILAGNGPVRLTNAVAVVSV